MSFYRKRIKRCLDFAVALIVFTLALPIFIIIYLLLFFANNKEPFFLQQRPGQEGSLFTIIKFRTMNNKKDKAGNLLPDSERLTAVGSLIRKTSLDEIPQLLNVLKGEMSLIGPRPLLTEYLPLYSNEQNRRHQIKPGITGWAQVNGRNAISWDQKFKLDVYYVDNLSFWLDLKIILLTIKKVIVKEGISSSTSVTMEKFKGN